MSLRRTWFVSKVDLIVVTDTPASLAAKSATTTIPIVMVSVGDPISCRFGCQSGAAWGQCHRFLEFRDRAKYQKARDTKDAVPKLTRVGFLRGVTAGIGSDLQLKEIRPAALALKVKLEEIKTQPDLKGLESAFQTAKQKQVGAMMMISSPRFFAERKPIVALAGKYRLPAIYFQKEFVDEGGLMSCGADYDDLYRKAAHYVDKILKSRKARRPTRTAGNEV